MNATEPFSRKRWLLILATGLSFPPGCILASSSQIQPTELQYGEGFQHILWAAGEAGVVSIRGEKAASEVEKRARPTLDFRGPTRAWSTLEWWRHPEKTDRPFEIVWETAPPPRQVDTVFSFVAATSPNQSGHESGVARARIFVNTEYLLTFSLGTRLHQRWGDGKSTLEFVPKHVQMPYDGYHRQFQTYGNSGLYQLRVPARLVRANRPNQIKVVVEARDGSQSWFAVHDRQDTLSSSAETNGEQIAQLQQEIIQLKRVIETLARRVYPELQTRRLPSQEVILYSQGRSHVHAANLVALQSGEILAVFREGSEHISADGRLVLVRSKDGGGTWGERQVVVDHPGSDDREASLTQLRDGTLLLTWWENPNYDESGVYRVPSPAPERRVEVWRSRDAGHSWVPWGRVDYRPIFSAISVSDPVVELPGGRLLMPAQVKDRQEEKQGSALFFSDDSGKTWGFLSIIAWSPVSPLVYAGDYSEPSITITRCGKVLAMLRTRNGNHVQVVSEDGGTTWGSPREIDLESRGHPANLITLSNGDILCSYGHRQRHTFLGPSAQGDSGQDQPSWVGIAVSHDEGETWPQEERYILRDDLHNADTGYLSSVQLRDGRILTQYYYNLFERFVIAGSIYRLPR